MDDIFTKLALHTATLVGKAAFAYSTNYALKQVTNYIKHDATNVPHVDAAEIERVKENLELSIQMVQPAIDLIEIISARGNTTLEPTVAHTTMLRKQIESFARTISKNSFGVDESTGTTSKKKPPLEHSKVIREMMDLIQKIEKFVPYLNLIMTTSGANLGWSLPNSVSPSRLLQASNALYEANRRFRRNNARQTRVGPVYKLKLYYMFTGSVRPKSVVDFTWKEEFTKCDAVIYRVSDTSDKEYAYELVLAEDLNDGRYHEEFDIDDPVKLKEIKDKLDKPSQSIPGKVRRIPVGEISRLYYTSSGSLLNIEESKTPVLVLKVIKGLSKAHLMKEGTSDMMDPHANPLYVPPMVHTHDESKDVKEHVDRTVTSYSRESIRTPSPRKIPLPDTPSPRNIPLPNTPISRIVSSLPGTPSPSNVSTPKTLTPRKIPLPVSDGEDSDATLSDDDENEMRKSEDFEISVEHRNPVINVVPDIENVSNILSTRGSTDATEVPDAGLGLNGFNVLDNDDDEMYQSNLKTLSLLEYLLRLSALEVCEQTSHLEIADEKINLFLKDDDSSGGSTNTATVTEPTPPGTTSHTSNPAASIVKPSSSTRRMLFKEDLNAMRNA
ncbi:1024_t:CDS:2 [Acaulospora morrowiae]|uniref:1024_t:CDS:1 n=1 Tax=Acaulospora morrowiae TaxID=94023 RepID=A0A9N8ZWH9_9GLOM|nr:1024_t:CDS:2 [Acaulospora morrowiae]